MEPEIIIIKKVAGHGGHHGGAWKVAYADFVTAMMALFILLWLMSASAEVKKTVGGYFQDPSGVGKQVGTGLLGTGDSLAMTKDDMADLKEKLQEAMRRVPEFQKLKEQVQMTVTGEGLRIELIETQRGMFFESGNAKPTPTAEKLLRQLASELRGIPNNILIEGHTDSHPFANSAVYTNWELSADRANAARRVMEDDGLRQGQVKQVRGFADQNLRKPKEPEDPSNRRVSVIIQYQPLAAAAPSSGHDAKDKKSAEPKEPPKSHA